MTAYFYRCYIRENESLHFIDEDDTIFYSAPLQIECPHCNENHTLGIIEDIPDNGPVVTSLSDSWVKKGT